MGIIPYLEQTKLHEFTWVSRRYYDYPDGEDLHGKLSFTTKVAGYVGIVAGSIAAVTGVHRPESLRGKLLKTGHVFLPCVGMAVLFTTVTYCSTRIRQKDDEWNYVFGGLAAGSLVGAFTTTPFMGPFGAVICAFLGAAQKHSVKKGKSFFDGNLFRFQDSFSRNKWDTTLISERKGNWTKEPLPE